MGNSDTGTPPKSDKVASPVQVWGARLEQANAHVYPDWAAIQAYYGPGVGLPPPYFGPPVTSGHAPHPFMWGPQPMMTPYGTPYGPIYPHGGVYAHPSMPIGSHSHVHGTASSGMSQNMMTTPLSIETPSKSLGNKDQGLMKRLKSFDGLAVSLGNGKVENTANGAAHGPSQSEDCGTEGSSDGSDGNSTQGNQTQRKRSREDTPVTASRDRNIDMEADNSHGGEANGSSTKTSGVTVAVSGVAGKPKGTVPLPSMTPGMEFRGSMSGKTKQGVASVPPATGVVVPARDGVPEHWMQDERELKRERRKQSNRESARRSRLRKQFETEELATKVESLNTENMALRAELDRLTKNSEKLRQENSVLMEKLKRAQLGATGETEPDEIEATCGSPPVGIENLLSRVNNSSSISRNGQREHENRENSSGKLHQLLESNSRTDAVAAG